MPITISQRSGTKLSQYKERRIRINNFAPYTPINFAEINAQAKKFAGHIESHFEEIADILLRYESFEVVQDETARTLDLLRHLEENKKYFALRIGGVTSFLPRNQPLYALTCFVLVPALMANEVHFRIPHSMRYFFPELLKLLNLKDFFPNVTVSSRERLEFLSERSALRMNSGTQQTLPVSDVVIFTGTPHHAERLRLVFDKRTLFIANGAGHNPVVISADADIPKAIEAVLTLQLYNQGQDCAAPNAILIHSHIFEKVLQTLLLELEKVQVGHYRDRSCRMGPISDPEDLVRIQQVLIENSRWIDSHTPGVISARDALMQPTIICKPLKEGGNFNEVFAPIFFLQLYEDDSDLALYFENPHYARNAMYITLYGTSDYIQHIPGKRIGERILHNRSSIIHNTHLHAAGVERGTQPYGGNGYGASSLSIDGKIICKPTLPQRDIYECVIRPLLKKGKLEKRIHTSHQAHTVVTRDIRKILGLKIGTCDEPQTTQIGTCYVDASKIKSNGQRFASFGPEEMFFLLQKPNVKHIASMEPEHLQQVRALRSFLQKEKVVTADIFRQWLYALPKKVGVSEAENRKRQLCFFQHLYHLLFGQHSGPSLASFLLDVDRLVICKLLDI